MRSRIPLILLTLLALFALPALARAAEVMPPKPARYFNDYANLISAPVVDQLNSKLEQFERDTSNQVWVVIYPKMQTQSDVADYTTRIFHQWHVGQKDKKNGIVLFVFVQDHKMQIITGYGLEGALPDAICKQIIDNEITPAFKARNYDQGVTAGVNAIIAATKGEYKGTGKTSNDNNSPLSNTIFVVLVLLILGYIIARQMLNSGGTHYSSGGWGGFGGGSSWGSGGGGWSSGGGDSGGGYSSSGGGDTGGGGAGGSW